MLRELQKDPTHVLQALSSYRIRIDRIAAYAPRFLIALGFLLTCIHSLRAQDVYVASWTIQDLHQNLRQDSDNDKDFDHGSIVRDIVRQANLWLTRNNPEAITVRYDDKITVTVLGQYNPGNGSTEERLIRLNIGGVLIEDDIEKFLDSAMIQDILLRNYYWRDETLNVLEPSLAPTYRQLPRERSAGHETLTYDEAFSATLPGRPSLSLGNAVLPGSAFNRTIDGIGLWAGFGNEELAMPGLSYRRLRLGVALDGVRAWYELPVNAEVGSAVTGSNHAASGAGLSFEISRFGGSLVLSNPYSAAPLRSDTAYMLSRGALLYYIQPIDFFDALDGWVRVKAGGGYMQGTRLLANDSGEVATGRTFDLPRAFVRVEYSSIDDRGQLKRAASLEAFGTSIQGSYVHRINRIFGIEGSATVHGVFGTQAPFLPSFAIYLSPTLYL